MATCPTGESEMTQDHATDHLGFTADELLDAFVNRPSFERFGEMREAIMRKWPVGSREPRQTDIAVAVRNAVVVCAMMIEANNKKLRRDLERYLGERLGDREVSGAAAEGDGLSAERESVRGCG
ncbi:MAG: hypothetical protein GW802_31565 [Armatimonadetes bacterium]|nr:hypothetical protein [Armatimonadota bacterium]